MLQSGPQTAPGHILAREIRDFDCPIGVGDTKMKIHRAAIARLFERNDQCMDAEEVYALAAGV